MSKAIPYKENHRETNGVLEKKCNHHHVYFPDKSPWMPCTDEYYYKNKCSTIDGLAPYCKECTKQKAFESKIRNRESYLASTNKYNSKPEIRQMIRDSARRQRERGYFEQWQRDNPGKVKEYNEKRQHKNHKLTDDEWENCKKYFNHRCAYCDLKIEEHWITYAKRKILGDFHKEHKDHFGADDLSNCIPSCKSCNDKKWEFGFDNWYNESNPVFSQERLDKINQWINEDYKLYISKLI